MYTTPDKAVEVLSLLTEGLSVSSVERITEVHHTTILKLLVQIGQRCEAFSIEQIKGVRVEDVQVDEIWSFIGKKELHKRPAEAHDAGIGDSYCFVALERSTKLVLTWHVGRRTKVSTYQFLYKLRQATAPAPYQLTSDGFRPYIEAVENVLPSYVSFGQLVKVYASPREGEARYSPPEVVGAIPTPIQGYPDPQRICTSHVERQNLTMRMQIRRLTRLTNAFSKKYENHRAALALYFCWYNFCRTHKTLRTTPAMASGVTDRVWTMRELLEALP